ncbi:MAG: spore cortex biosynthesis protein YabQ [Suilimivivens sp.]
MVISQDIAREVVFLFHSFLLGAVITFVYDGFLILRKLFRHTVFLISLEDLVFWIACAIGVFCVLYEENNGTLRWFAVAGAALGMLIYKKTLSPLIIHVIFKVFSYLFHILGKLFRLIGKPFQFLFGKAVKSGRFAGRKAGLLGKYIKKKLTQFKKTLRIILCKQ